ncbi:hypothetical protein ACS0TY_009898 [Phlomoides rotata]
MSLVVDEEEELILAPEVSEGLSVNVENCLVVKMTNVWRLQKGVVMKDVGEGQFLFQFFHPIDN